MHRCTCHCLDIASIIIDINSFMIMKSWEIIYDCGKYIYFDDLSQVKLSDFKISRFIPFHHVVSVLCHISQSKSHNLTHRSKHILNAQVSIRAPCCKQWYDCAECHAENQSHNLRKTTEIAFMCKKCKKAFRKDMSNYEESDEFCPHCDNHYVR